MGIQAGRQKLCDSLKQWRAMRSTQRCAFARAFCKGLSHLQHSLLLDEAASPRRQPYEDQGTWSESWLAIQGEDAPGGSWLQAESRDWGHETEARFLAGT